ncbi:endonuclease SmrB [Alteromonadaceae bacterium M269]|nr:endonuclease SmrB [Alteromonadaceae bacterium M269]
MPKNTPTEDEVNLFKQALDGVQPMEQDKIPPQSLSSKKNPEILEKKKQQLRNENRLAKQAAASFHFSDGFEAHFDESGPLKYVKPGTDHHEAKRLRRGDYPPELILDLHGYKKLEAKQEVAALIYTAQKKHYHCICIVHGIGTKILKQNVPSWLVQHPAILAFHQAPLEWGGKGALLALVDTL